MNKPTELKITEEAPEGLINEASMSAARDLIGSKLRPEQYLRDASLDAITIFSNGIGDLNPLYRDQEYARWTRFGGLIAHPCFPWTHHWPGRSYWGLPGVHGFGVAIDCEYMRNVRPGDRISIWNRVIDVQEKQSKFSGKMAMQYLESTYINQRDEILCRALGYPPGTQGAIMFGTPWDGVSKIAGVGWGLSTLGNRPASTVYVGGTALLER